MSVTVQTSRRFISGNPGPACTDRVLDTGLYTGKNPSANPDGAMIDARGQRTQHLLGWMEALSDPTRLRLLRLLERHELGVVEVCDILQLPQSTVSRQLKVLGDQKWVR